MYPEATKVTNNETLQLFASNIELGENILCVCLETNTIFYERRNESLAG
jgi:hypothetical protein